MEMNRADPDALLRSITKSAPAERGHLKIFFGYAAGVGKTYAMLEAAHEAKARGVDVVCGYIEPHARKDTLALKEGLEQLEPLQLDYNGISLKDFDLDAALARNPQIVLVDELAHTNVPGMRHAKRYMDVKELLRKGIDVYTTVNVQHIESLCDTVAAITGITVQERIPDSIFDEASQVELVDLEPADLLERFKEGKVYAPAQAKLAAQSFFTEKNLAALREIALRRCADRVNEMVESIRIQSGADYHTDEKVLVCLSSSPSNPKIIRTAARMAKAFHGTLTAVFVETPDLQNLSKENRQRLDANIDLARRLGAVVETIKGDDIPEQIAQYARLSGVSKVVLGRSNARRKIFGKPVLTEKLIGCAPNLDIYIIPDQSIGQSMLNAHRQPWYKIGGKDIAIIVFYLLAASLISWAFSRLQFSDVCIVSIYLLSVLLCSMSTASRGCAAVSAVLSALAFNLFFLEPKLSLSVNSINYLVTFVVMIAVGLVSGTLAHRLRENSRLSAASAWNSQVLFECNQTLQQASSQQEILDITARQIQKLLDTDIVLYAQQDGELQPGKPYQKTPDSALPAGPNEFAIADWVFHNNKRAGCGTDTLASSPMQYLAIRIEDRVYGVCGINLKGTSLSPEESSMLLAILGESAMAMEMAQNAKEKEEAAILYENEQLRGNLLRSISHDFRTPLTAIRGNASMLEKKWDQLDPERRKRLLGDIKEDASWLNTMMENLLSLTRLEEKQVELNLQPEMMDEVITEAISHIPHGRERISVVQENPYSVVHADGHLLVQVITNLCDNALKYSPPASPIEVATREVDGRCIVEVRDEGFGIDKDQKKLIFDRFYTTHSHPNKAADSARSVGLGLALCKSIVEAHHGIIEALDNHPKGTIFRFDVPLEQMRPVQEA